MLLSTHRLACLLACYLSLVLIFLLSSSLPHLVLYYSRLDDLESLNEALRRALSMRLYNNVENSGTRGEGQLPYYH